MIIKFVLKIHLPLIIILTLFTFLSYVLLWNNVKNMSSSALQRHVMCYFERVYVYFHS